MKRINCIGVSICIVMAIISTIFIVFFISPLYLSLDIFGIQDAVYTYPTYLYVQFYTEFSFYLMFGFLYITSAIFMLIKNVKTYKKSLILAKIKKNTKVLTILSIVSILIYCLGTLIINYLNNSNKVQWKFYLFTLLPILLYSLATIYFYLVMMHFLKKQTDRKQCNIKS